MSVEDHALLVELYITGEISPEERTQLLRSLDEDAALQQRFPRDVQLAVRLAGLLREMSDHEQFAASPGAAVSSDHARLSLVQRVEQRLQERRAKRIAGDAVASPSHDDSARQPRTGSALPSSRRRHSGRSVSGRWLAIAACLLAAVGLALAIRPSATDAERQRFAILGASAATQVFRDDKMLEARVGMDLLPQDLIRVEASPADGAAEVLFTDHSRIDLRAGTQARLWDEDGAKRVRLDRGELRCEIAHQPPGKPMKLLTEQAEAEVVGTLFMLQADKDRTRLAVEQGEVSLRRSDGKAVSVRAGYAAVAGADVPLEPAPIATESGAPPRRSSQRPDPRGSVVFLREFDALAPGEGTTNDLVVLSEAGRPVTAIVSKPYPEAEKASTWKPDVFFRLSSVTPDAAGDKVLWRVPENVEIRIRLRAEKPGTWNLSMMPTNPHFQVENCYAAGLEIDDSWREAILHRSDIKSYTAEGPSREFAPGLDIGAIGIFGFGTGTIFVDRITVLSLTKD